jgi:hypothetical protein
MCETGFPLRSSARWAEMDSAAMNAATAKRPIRTRPRCARGAVVGRTASRTTGSILLERVTAKVRQGTCRGHLDGRLPASRAHLCPGTYFDPASTEVVARFPTKQVGHAELQIDVFRRESLGTQGRAFRCGPSFGRPLRASAYAELPTPQERGSGTALIDASATVSCSSYSPRRRRRLQSPSW